MQRAEKSIRVAAPVDDVYRFWRDFENLPKFMENVKEVRRADSRPDVWHWTVKGPMNMSLEFDAHLTEDQPGRSIGWNSTEGAIGTSGNVTFRDLQNNTEVHVIVQWFDTPIGRGGESLSRVIANPEKMLEEDLRRFKEMMEQRVREPVRSESTPVHTQDTA
jgi:uncharacterized membrane protein